MLSYTTFYMGKMFFIEIRLLCWKMEFTGNHWSSQALSLRRGCEFHVVNVFCYKIKSSPISTKLASFDRTLHSYIRLYSANNTVIYNGTRKKRLFTNWCTARQNFSIVQCCIFIIRKNVFDNKSVSTVNINNGRISFGKNTYA